MKERFSVQRSRFRVDGERNMVQGGEYERIGFSGGGTSKHLMGRGAFSSLTAA